MAFSRHPTRSSTARDEWERLRFERHRWQALGRAEQERMLRLLNGTEVPAEPVQLTFEGDRRRAA